MRYPKAGACLKIVTSTSNSQDKDVRLVTRIMTIFMNVLPVYHPLLTVNPEPGCMTGKRLDDILKLVVLED